VDSPKWKEKRVMDVSELFEHASGKLPTIPKVVQELIASFQQEEINVDEIADKVAHDQVISARVLRLANSARYGGNRRIGSLDDAVVMLGFDNLRMLVIASGMVSTTINVPGFNMQAFWQRSLELANTARLLGKAARLDMNVGYSCGLLANIGELVLHVGLPTQTAQIDKAVEGGADRVATERMILGMDMTNVGAELARRWNFPETIQEAILHQYEPLEAQPPSPYAVLLALTTYIVSGFNRGVAEGEMATVLPEALLAPLNLTQEKLAELMPELKESSTVVDELV
jgi:HD-like signal output (HDOD) protein